MDMKIDSVTMSVIMGALLLVVGIFATVKDRKLRKGCTATANATIVDIKTKIEHDAGETGSDTTKYIPVLEFYANGSQVVAEGNQSSGNREKYHVGDSMEIIYNPDKPTILFMDTQAKTNKFSLLLTVIGAAMLVYGIVSKAGLF